MSAEVVLGLVGTLLGVVRALPQLLKLRRERRPAGVSADTAATSAIVGAGWVGYGAATGQPFVSLATAASAVIYVGIWVLTLRFGGAARLRVAPVWVGALLAAYAVAGIDGLGVLLPLSVLVANAPQVRVAATATNLAGLSVGTWALCCADGLTWLAYSRVTDSLGLLGYGVLQAGTSGAIVVLALARSRAVVRA